MKHRFQMQGTIDRDAEDIRWIIEHWEITKWLVELEKPDEGLITVAQCDKHLDWLRSALRVAAGDGAAQQSL